MQSEKRTTKFSSFAHHFSLPLFFIYCSLLPPSGRSQLRFCFTVTCFIPKGSVNALGQKAIVEFCVLVPVLGTQEVI